MVKHNAKITKKTTRTINKKKLPIFGKDWMDIPYTLTSTIEDFKGKFIDIDYPKNDKSITGKLAIYKRNGSGHKDRQFLVVLQNEAQTLFTNFNQTEIDQLLHDNLWKHDEDNYFDSVFLPNTEIVITKKDTIILNYFSYQLELIDHEWEWVNDPGTYGFIRDGLICYHIDLFPHQSRDIYIQAALEYCLGDHGFEVLINDQVKGLSVEEISAQILPYYARQND